MLKMTVWSLWSGETGPDTTRLANRIRIKALNICMVRLGLVWASLIFSVTSEPYLCFQSAELSEMSDIIETKQLN